MTVASLAMSTVKLLADQVELFNSSTCVSAFVEILQSLHCKIFKYTFLGQYQMKP